MPSFDVVSEVDKHELTNAVDQANRELSTRFDFKGYKRCINYVIYTTTIKILTNNNVCPYVFLPVCLSVCLSICL